MFSLLATTNDPANRFQKLNEIHRRRLSHWNCHTDSLTFVARSHHRHQALAMTNNATNDIDRVQRIQNFCARIICKVYDYINTRGLDLVESLAIQTIRQRRDYFLSVLMFKCIHGLVLHYLCNDVTMIADVHDYNTRSSENRNLYAPNNTLWNDLPDEVK